MHVVGVESQNASDEERGCFRFEETSPLCLSSVYRSILQRQPKLHFSLSERKPAPGTRSRITIAGPRKRGDAPLAWLGANKFKGVIGL